MLCLQVYDLKGSLRHRKVENPHEHDTLWDENLLEDSFENPICVVRLRVAWRYILSI